MINSVVGFYFSEDLSKVVLIRKISKPGLERHEGLLNGVGGKISSEDESLTDCMVREFKEETGKITVDSEWQWYTTEVYPEYTVYFFYASGRLDGISTQEEEQIEIHNVADIDTLPVISNVPRLISQAFKYMTDHENY